MPFRITKDALPFAIPLGIVAVVLFVLGWPIPAAACVVATVCVTLFFRDPKRTPPTDPALVIAPADGLVVGVQEVDEPDYLGGPAVRVSIFLRLWNVHMTYAPINGTVEHIAYRHGRFGIAGFSKASDLNEANSIGVRSPGGRLMFRQIAGMIARRIVCRIGPGDEVRCGERVGLIKFGSRVDVFLPKDCEVLVRRGDLVRAALSPIARQR